jgi:hypothetical protein
MKPLLSNDLRVECFSAAIGDDVDAVHDLNEWLGNSPDVLVVETQSFVHAVNGTPHLVVLVWWQCPALQSQQASVPRETQPCSTWDPP